MAGSTPIYGFPYPEPSDLVANYPALGQDLAEDIEAVLPTLGGITKVTAQAFSAVATVNVNNCFSATYKNYRLVWKFITNTSGSGIDLLPRAAGSNITTNLSSTRIVGASGGVTSATEASTWTARIAAGANTTGIAMDWLDPFATQKSAWLAINNQDIGLYLACGQHNAATSYDGFQFTAGGINMTGTVYVYGYKD